MFGTLLFFPLQGNPPDYRLRYWEILVIIILLLLFKGFPNRVVSLIEGVSYQI